MGDGLFAYFCASFDAIFAFSVQFLWLFRFFFLYLQRRWCKLSPRHRWNKESVMLIL